MSLEKLKNAKSLQDLAGVLSWQQPKTITYILYKIPDNKKYSEFEIPKKNGETRLIQAPRKELKLLQKRLTYLLNKCSTELDKEKKKKILAHGFKKECSIHTHAKLHKNKRYVLNFDIENFFPSINFGRVRGFFIKNKDFQLNEKVATIIAQIACYNNQLPQGGPCSPIISNFIAHILDVSLVQIAKKYKCTYSRYVDDITFSTGSKTFPEEIAFQDSEKPDIWCISEDVKKNISRSGFKINVKKTRMSYKNSRQTVTGLVVNEKVNVKSEYYKLARAMTHSLFTKGKYRVPGELNPIDISDSNSSEIKKIYAQLGGILNHIYYTRKFSHNKNLKCESKKSKQTGIEKLFRDFFFFKKFIALNKPTLISEGPTDVIYIKLALKKFKDKYPSLIKKEDRNMNYSLQFLNRKKGYLLQKLGFNEGVGGLEHLINIYKNTFKTFTAWENPKYPVIILSDNDEEAKKLFNNINNKYEINISQDSKDAFFHIWKNLYLIKVPNGPCIENLFCPKWLKDIKWQKKKFSSEKKHDKSKFYGKMILATKVIPQNFSSVDFENFKPLLNSISEAIKDYKNKYEKLNLEKKDKNGNIV